MKIRIVILIFIKLIAVNYIFACSCGSFPGPDFFTVAPNSKLVALVKINRYLTFKEIQDHQAAMSMEAEIITVFHGQETRKTITVWGDNGAMCRPYLNTFKVGSYYIIAFGQCSNFDEEKETDYDISICGEYWLSADNEKKIAKNRNQSKISFSDLSGYFNGYITEALFNVILEKKERVFQVVSREPVFPGGDSIFNKWYC